MTIVSECLPNLSPDHDLLAWLCERWAQQPTPSGVMRPTLYEIGSDLYACAPSAADYARLRAALDRLARVTVQIAGIDALTGEPGDFETRGHLLSQARDRRTATGEQRMSVELDGWLRRAISDGAPVRIPWRTLKGSSTATTSQASLDLPRRRALEALRQRHTRRLLDSPRREVQ